MRLKAIFDISTTRRERCRQLRFIVCALFAFAAGLQAQAQRPNPPEGTSPRDGAQFVPVQQNPVSLQEAIAIASAQVMGTVARADTVTRNGRLVHEVVILREDGLVRTVHVDPATGTIL